MKHSQLAPLLLLALLPFAASCSTTRGGPGGTGPIERGAGFYAKAFAGYGGLEDAESIYTQAATSVENETSFSSGPMYGVAAGYSFDDSWSLELEYAYRSNDLDESTGGPPTLAGDGDLASVAVMLNAYYAFDVDWAVKPYVGLGFGLAQEVDFDVQGGDTSGNGSYSSESPAAQFMVGATKPLTEGIDAYAEGRFFRAFDPDLGAESGASNAGGRVETEYGHGALLLGLQFRF